MPSMSVKSRKLLWGRSGMRCAFPGCRTLLVEEASALSPAATIGEEAHIVAQSPDGPRGGEPPPGGEIDGHENLILLCANHHAVVDSQWKDYPVPRLLEFKRSHEEAVLAALEPDKCAGLAHAVLYAELVDEWVDRAQLDRWNAWTSYLLSEGQPSLRTTDFARLRDLARWLANRVWPGTDTALEDAFSGFAAVLADFLNEFRRSGRTSGDFVEVYKLYKDPAYMARDQVEEATATFHRNVYIIEELSIELTCMANMLADLIRASLTPRFRLDEGYVTITRGPTAEEFDTWTTIAARYSKGLDSRTESYRGLECIRREAEERYAMGESES